MPATELVGAAVVERLAAPATRERLGTALAALADGPERESRLALACALRGGERELELWLRAWRRRRAASRRC